MSTGKVTVLHPKDFFGYTELPTDEDELWNLFVTKGFKFVTDIVEKGLGSKKNTNVDKNVYMAIRSFVSDRNAIFTRTQFGTLMDSYVKVNVAPALACETGVNLLQEFRRRWHNHLFMSCWMCRFASGLDPDEVSTPDKPFVATLVLRSFMYAYEPQKQRIVDAMLAEVTKYRDVESSDDPDMILVADVSLILQHMGAVKTKHNIKKVIEDNVKEWKSGLWKRAPGLVKQTFQSYINGVMADETRLLATTVVYIGDFHNELIPQTRSYYKNKSAAWASAGTVRYVSVKVACYFLFIWFSYSALHVLLFFFFFFPFSTVRDNNNKF